MKNFIKCAAVRAVKTVCQTAIGVIGASAVMSEVDWTIVGSASLLSGIISVLTSISTGLLTKRSAAQNIHSTYRERLRISLSAA